MALRRAPDSEGLVSGFVSGTYSVLLGRGGISWHERRAATLDPDRERRNGRIRTAAVRRLIATYRAEYRALLREERARLGGGANAA